MSLDLITPSTEEPVSLAELKAHLRVAHGDEDAAIAAYGLAARRAVEERGGLALVSQDWRLALDRMPEGVLVLPRSPVFSVISVCVIDRAGLSSLVPASLYEVEAGAAGRLVARGAWPYSDRQIARVRIDFTAGWPSAADAPEELKLAVKMLAAHFYENREGALAERLFSTPQTVDALIAPYRRVRL